MSALLTLDAEAAQAWAREQGIDGDPATLASSEELIAEVQRGLDVANQDLARVEQVKRFVILPADWEPGGDELTPTMKLKRKPIAEKYAAGRSRRSTTAESVAHRACRPSPVPAVPCERWPPSARSGSRTCRSGAALRSPCRR